MKHTLLILTALILFSCNSEGDKAGETCAHSLDGLWLKSGSPRIELDFRGIAVGQVATVQVDYTNLGAQQALCSYDYLVQGSGCSGTWSASNASRVSGTANCNDLVGLGTYTNTGTNLSVCDSVGCYYYTKQ